MAFMPCVKDGRFAAHLIASLLRNSLIQLGKVHHPQRYPSVCHRMVQLDAKTCSNHRLLGCWLRAVAFPDNDVYTGGSVHCLHVAKWPGNN